MIEENRRDFIHEVFINTNEKNTMTDEFFLKLEKCLSAVEDDRSVKAIFLSSKNEKFFSNGFEPTMFIGKTQKEIETAFRPVLDSVFKLAFYPKPIVCYINGHVMGVGSVVAIVSDYRVMLHGRARFGFPESKIGVGFPSATGFFLKELLGYRAARDVLNFGKAYKAEEALEIGLVDAIGKEEEIPKILNKIFSNYKDMALESVIGMKKTLRDYMKPIMEPLGREDVYEFSRTIAAPNGQEGMRSIVEARRPMFQ
ncbi:MAG: enoyl-CoA hydratase/isomerase family protein [Leptospiraceae bacterium]|nr:enoyl-CoA hydratase/isomerase family protein [Leptospiraceae bacterium]MCP5500885.1 enoyl-CoA hydratase/isomerase family protein [Leptospiraceae bacterium]